MDHHPRLAGVNIALVKDSKILLQRRSNTSWAGGMLCLPGGHLEEGETASEAAIRELKEELGLAITPGRVTLFAVAYIRTNHENVNAEFCAILRDSETPTNMEPDKCSELVWCTTDNLPLDVHDVFRTIIIDGYVKGSRYLEIGY